jgi:hypothetical protein
MIMAMTMAMTMASLIISEEQSHIQKVNKGYLAKTTAKKMSLHKNERSIQPFMLKQSMNETIKTYFLAGFFW